MGNEKPIVVFFLILIFVIMLFTFPVVASTVHDIAIEPTTTTPMMLFLDSVFGWIWSALMFGCLAVTILVLFQH